jgi:hypothetical protein
MFFSNALINMKRRETGDVIVENRLLGMVQSRIGTKQTGGFALAAVKSLLLVVLVAFAAGLSSPRPGTYAMSIGAEDDLPNVPAEIRSNFDGKWQLTFAGGNRFQISKDAKVVVEGRFTSVVDHLTFTDEKGVLACTQPPGMETGTYKWSNNKKDLTFTVVEDKCGGRLDVLTLHPWLKAK